MLVGLSRKAIFSAVSASLSRLNTSYIHLLQIHRFDPETPIEETMSALHDLVKDGKVRYISVSDAFLPSFDTETSFATLPASEGSAEILTASYALFEE